MHRDDPRQTVEAPIRGALVGVVARGLAMVGIVVVGALAPAVPVLRDITDQVAIAVTALLVLFGLAYHAARTFSAPLDEELRARAWYRAREIDADDAMLALVFAGWVPVALASALVVMLWPHLNDPNPALRGAWAVLAIPPIVTAWLFATTSWLDACRDALARAIGESDRRFRSYWANVGR